MKKILLFGLLALSCSTARQADQKGEFKRKLVYKVESYCSVESLSGKLFFFEPPADWKTLENQIYTDRIRKMLTLEGMTFSAIPKNADLFVTASLEVTTPPLGMSIGTLSPYQHKITITVKDMKSKKSVMSLTSNAPSEESDTRKVLPQILGAARHVFCQNTPGVVRLSLPDDDEKALEISQ